MESGCLAMALRNVIFGLDNVALRLAVQPKRQKSHQDASRRVADWSHITCRYSNKHLHSSEFDEKK